MTRKQLVKAMGQEQKIIAAARDKLRDLNYTAQSIIDDADDALDSLDYVIETLSRQQ